MPPQVYVDDTACLHAQRTQRLYEKLRAAHPSGPLHARYDNARYDKNKALTAWRAGKRLGQVFLPPSSPNQNRSERRWNYLRQKTSNPAFYRTKGECKSAVLSFFDRLGECGPALASLRTLKSHILDSRTSS